VRSRCLSPVGVYARASGQFGLIGFASACAVEEKSDLHIPLFLNIEKWRVLSTVLHVVAWAHAFPGREVAERSAVLRELSQLQQQPRGAGAMLYRRERIHPTGCVGRDGAQ
jgi:hypothetical protein